MKLSAPAKAPAAVPQGTIECTICGYIVNAVEGYLAENKTETEIVQLLENDVCAILGPIKSTCDALVAQYLLDIIQYLESNQDPTTVCQEIGLCAASQAPVAVETQANPVAAQAEGSIECTICGYIVKAVEGYLADIKTETEIEQLLESDVCGILGPLKDTGNALVAQYLPDIIQYLETNQNPTQVCQEIGLCAASQAPVPAKPVQQQQPEQPEGSIECTIY